MEKLITNKTPAIVNVQFYKLCKVNKVDKGNNFISEIKPIFITILSELLKPLKEDDENRFNNFLKRLIEYYFSEYDSTHLYEMDQIKYISFFKTIIRGPNVSEKRIIKNHYGYYKTNRNYLQQTFNYFQKKYNYSSGKDALTFPNQLNFPKFGKLPMSVKRKMTLKDVKKLTQVEKKGKIGSMELILKLSLIIHKCTQLYETNLLLSSFKDQQLKDIQNYFKNNNIYDNEIELEINSRNEKKKEAKNKK